jgi:hypothetical protein
VGDAFVTKVQGTEVWKRPSAPTVR